MTTVVWDIFRIYTQTFDSGWKHRTGVRVQRRAQSELLTDF